MSYSSARIRRGTAAQRSLYRSSDSRRRFLQRNSPSDLRPDSFHKQASLQICRAQPESEGELRLNVLCIEVAIADVDSFSVIHLQIYARIVSISRRVFPLLRK